MSNQWGNPNLKSFKNNHIRRVLVDLSRVFVNRKITVETEDLLIRAASYGAVFSQDKLPTILPAYEMDDTEEAKLGLKLRIPNFDKSMPCEDLGFRQDGDVFIFVGETTEVNRQSLYDNETALIGSREVKEGDTGADVEFLAYFLGVESPHEKKVFDIDIAEAVNYLQKRMGIPETGFMDSYTWNSILPRQTDRIADGFAGQKVRALQSALKVNGYNTPVTSRFGVETLKKMRDFQSDNDLRITGKAGLLEWRLLFFYE